MEPNTLQEAILYFASPNNCREYLVAHRWPNGVTCPRCGSTKVLLQAKYNRWQCGSKHPLRQFTSKAGTIFEDSPLGLDKWLREFACLRRHSENGMVHGSSDSAIPRHGSHRKTFGRS